MPPRPYFDSSLLRLNARTFAVLCPARFCGHRAFTVCPVLWTHCFLLSVRFCGHRAFTVCPVLWTPRLYCLSTFVDTLLLLPVHFCGHPAFTVCPLLWTPCFYCLSTFVDTAPLLPVRFCGHHAFTACPLLWTPRFLLSVRFCGHHSFTICPLLWALSIHGNSKFQHIGIFNDAFLRVNNGFLPNILAFTLNFSIRRQSEIP